MDRNIAKDIETYRKIFKGKNEKFYTSDFVKIKEIAEHESEKWGGKSSSNILFYAITSALEAGFVIGLRYGKR